MSGTLSVGSLVVENGSFSLNQIMTIEPESHNDVVAYNDNSIDSAYVDGFVNKKIKVEDLTSADPDEVPTHNHLLVWDDTLKLWGNKGIISLYTGLTTTVNAVVSDILNLKKGTKKKSASADVVGLTDETSGGYTMSITSCGDNNIVYKREVTDDDFSFLQVMSSGEQSHLTLTAGTRFKSTKGLTGFSIPFCFPMGSSALAGTFFKIYARWNTESIYLASAGLESVVTLYSSDGTTVIDGPNTVEAYGVTFLTVDNSESEFIVEATTNVFGSVKNSLDNQTKCVVPSSLEIVVWNRVGVVVANESNTLVRWYRRNGETGSVTINSGTPQNIYTGNINEDSGGENNAGNTVDYFPDGCLILRADKPIIAASHSDGYGNEATPGLPLTNLAQLFANPSTVGKNARADRSSVSIGSPYEGTGYVYDDENNLLSTFTYTRSVTPATTAEEQLYPAAGQWQPNSTTGVAWVGGYIICNTPAYCVMNFDQSTTFTEDGGEETMILGTTPEYLRAVIRKDDNGILRRRDIDASGTETLTIC